MALPPRNPQTDLDILEFYARGDEEQRLVENAAGLLEQARTEELLQRFLPAPPGPVIDVGGGTGRYAVWLAEHGYDVHLVDPVATHVEQAANRSATARRPLASARVGDARRLAFDDGCAAGVLLLGPLYHLTSRADRVVALAEARRVLLPGGVVLCAVISRFASALDGLGRHFLDDPVYREIVRRDLADGQHRDALADATRGRRAYFTTAYLHRPEEIGAELAEAGLEHQTTLAIEGPAWLLQDLDVQWADAERRSTLLELVRALEAETLLLGASSHLQAVGRKPWNGTQR
jgi:ubiquinone/menaquinone biosynthesis C-methylase UbiE